MMITNTRWLDAAQRQMPTLWANDEATVREYLHQAGGGVMVLQRTADEATGAHIVLSEDDALWLTRYADDGEKCEGHQLQVVGLESSSNAVWWFMAWAPPADPCPCLADNA